jgi:hypothetical protein
MIRPETPTPIHIEGIVVHTDVERRRTSSYRRTPEPLHSWHGRPSFLPVPLQTGHLVGGFGPCSIPMTDSPLALFILSGSAYDSCLSRHRGVSCCRNRRCNRTAQIPLLSRILGTPSFASILMTPESLPCSSRGSHSSCTYKVSCPWPHFRNSDTASASPSRNLHWSSIIATPDTHPHPDPRPGSSSWRLVVVLLPQRMTAKLAVFMAIRAVLASEMTVLARLSA